MSKPLFFMCVLFLLASVSYAQGSTENCSTCKFADKNFVSCLDLRVLNASIYWTYNESFNAIDMAFRMGIRTKDRWVAWGINPTSKHMVGSQTFVALRQSDGSVKAYTSPIDSYDTRLVAGNLSFPVFGVSAKASEDDMVIFAEFQLPVNASSANHLWQVGPVVNNIPGMHALTGANVRSAGTLDFMSGISMPMKRTEDSRMKMKIAHGVLNTISWGIMMPIGVIMARYVKVVAPANAAWFYLHITCQITAYVIGIAGGAMGFLLGRQSSGIQYSAHKYIGITLFVLASSQVLAICFKP